MSLDSALIIIVFLSLLLLFNSIYTSNKGNINYIITPFTPKEKSDITSMRTLENISIKNCSAKYNTTTIEIKTFHPLLARNIRWSRIPIRVYIQKDECSFGEVEEIERGLDEWNKMLGRRFFTIVEFPEKYDVKVKCTEFIENSESRNGIVVLGEAKIDRIIDTGMFNVTSNATVYIKTRTKKCIKPITVIHEFGHILGLDHVDDKENVMYPFEDCNEEIKNYTVKTIRNLYSYPPLPELALKNITIEAENNRINISGTVENYGIVESNKTTIEVVIDGNRFYALNIPRLKPGEGIKFSIKGSVEHRFTELKVVVDPENRTEEMFENNNEFVLEC